MTDADIKRYLGALGWQEQDNGQFRNINDYESGGPMDYQALSAKYGRYADPTLFGTMGYQSSGAPAGMVQAGAWANNAADPAQAWALEQQHLANYGITPQWDPQYGWLAPDDAALARAHPAQGESGFDRALGAAFRYGIPAVMTAGIGAGISGAGGLSGLMGGVDATAPLTVGGGASGVGAGLAGAGAAAGLSGYEAIPSLMGEGTAAANSLIGAGAGAAGAAGAAGGLGGAAAGAAASPLAQGLSNLLGVPAAALQPWLQTLGTVGATALGYDAARDYANTLRDISTQQTTAEQSRLTQMMQAEQARYDDLKAMREQDIARAAGAQTMAANQVAPFQQRLDATFQPGYEFNDPGFQDMMKQSARAFTNAASIRGNPADSPNAWQQTMQDLYEKNAYPALQNYRALNANLGYSGPYANVAAGPIAPTVTGLPSFNQPSVPLGTGAGALAQAGQQNMNAVSNLAGGLSSLVNPVQNTSIADLLRLIGSGSGSNLFRPIA